ncbi:hypothetical protein TNCV_1802851 [Trichonephila clavipes]|uniref:Uncharacterized protein n=1 Tax=Trichonephila clavipes TaxID=2585209 RepID=A0A8X6VHZ0_TRICX|nr:hypothetical protein TNCV_1802851 [Trichonephila clavipes]
MIEGFSKRQNQYHQYGCTCEMFEISSINVYKDLIKMPKTESCYGLLKYRPERRMTNVVQANKRATVHQIAGILIKEQLRTSLNELFRTHHAVLSMVAHLYVNEALSVDEKIYYYYMATLPLKNHNLFC